MRRNRCPACAYRLTGLPVSHVCPECGFAYDPLARVIRSRAVAYVDGVLVVFLVGVSIAIVARPPHGAIPLYGLGYLSVVVVVLLYSGIRSLFSPCMLRLNRAGVEIVAPPKMRVFAAWEQFEDARYSWRLRELSLIGKDDVTVASVDGDELGGWLAGSRCALVINRARDEYLGGENTDEDEP